jgi:hypothetical protein
MRFYLKLQNAKTEREVEDTWNEETTKGEVIKVKISEKNLLAKFDVFCQKVIKNAKSIDANVLVGMFIGRLINKEEFYPHPENRTLFVAHNEKFAINRKEFDKFFEYYEEEYSPQDKARIAAIADQIIEGLSRRRKGEFYTPQAFVSYAYNLIAKHLGEDWNEKYVVWDPAWGTGNLTRGKKFGELYASTINYFDLAVAEKFNPEAIKFEYDFLNDDCKDLPEGLLKAFKENRPILILVNPPYGTAGVKGATGKDKCGIANQTEVWSRAKSVIGKCVENVYAQFLYRFWELKDKFKAKNVKIALFCKPGYLTQTSYASFRKLWFDNFHFIDGVLFNASHFSDTADTWGISFALFDSNKQKSFQEFSHRLLDYVGLEVDVVGTKTLYNIDGLQSCSDWCKEPVKKLPRLRHDEYPQLSSGCTVKDAEFGRGTFGVGAIGSYLNSGNAVYDALQDTAIYTAGCSKGNEFPITAENFERVIVNFAARKTVDANWVNDKDEFLPPNKRLKIYQEFVNDAIVYSLFNSSSQQTSLRQIKYAGRMWNVPNEFFWMSKNVITELAERHNVDYTYNDAKNAGERFVYKRIQDIEFASAARQLLDKATELVQSTFQNRIDFNDGHPELHILSWDAGYYQLRALWKEYAPDGLAEVQQLERQLGAKLRPLVYELGMLRR